MIQKTDQKERGSARVRVRRGSRRFFFFLVCMYNIYILYIYIIYIKYKGTPTLVAVNMARMLRHYHVTNRGVETVRQNGTVGARFQNGSIERVEGKMSTSECGVKKGIERKDKRNEKKRKEKKEMKKEKDNYKDK